MSAKEFKITGRVQGVGFRYFVLTTALSFDIKGEVWNAADGTVHGVAIGDNIDQFLNALRDGPGRVDDILTNETASKQYDSFEIVFSR